MKTGTQTIPRVRQRAIADIQCWHSRQHAIHCHSMQCMRKRQRDREESRGRQREEEYSHVCISLSISLSLHLPQSVLWRADKLKKTGREKVDCYKEGNTGWQEEGRQTGRETEGESRCRKSSPSSACHLLLYVPSLSGEVIGFLMQAYVCL